MVKIRVILVKEHTAPIMWLVSREFITVRSPWGEVLAGPDTGWTSDVYWYKYL